MQEEEEQAAMVASPIASHMVLVKENGISIYVRTPSQLFKVENESYS